MNNEINGENSLNGVNNNIQNVQPNDLSNQTPVNDNQMNNSSLGTENMFQAPTGIQEQQMPSQSTDNNINNNQQKTGGIFSNNFQNINNDGSLRIAIKEDAKTKPKERLLLGVILGAISIFSIFFVTSLVLGFITAKVPLFGIVTFFVILFGMTFLGCCFLGGFIQATMKMSKVGEIPLKEIFSWPFNHKKLCIQSIVISAFYSLIILVVYIVSFLLFHQGVLVVIALLLIGTTIFIVSPMITMSVYSIIDEDNTDKGIIKCIKQGFRISKDRILQYNALQFSYAGWMLLQPLSLGILIPDMAYAKYNFYKYARGEKTFEKTKTGISDKGLLLILVGCILVFIAMIGLLIGASANRIGNARDNYNNYDSWDVDSYDNNDNDDYNIDDDSDESYENDDYDFDDSDSDEDSESDNYRVKQ